MKPLALLAASLLATAACIDDPELADEPIAEAAAAATSASLATAWKIKSNGDLGAAVGSMDVFGAWADADVFYTSDGPHVILTRYSGGVAIFKIGPDGALDELAYSDTWTIRSSSIQAYWMEGKLYAMTVSAQSGMEVVRELNENLYPIRTVEVDQWSSGWTTARVANIRGNLVLFTLKSGNGRAHVNRIYHDGQVNYLMQEFDWKGGWTTAEFFKIGNQDYMFFLKEDGGDVDISKMNNDGTIGPTIYSNPSNWSSGWASAVFWERGGTTYMLNHKASGEVDISTMKNDGTFGKLVHEHQLPAGKRLFVSYVVDGQPYVLAIPKE